jgi:hypothetical protein
VADHFFVTSIQKMTEIKLLTALPSFYKYRQ